MQVKQMRKSSKQILSKSSQRVTAQRSLLLDLIQKSGGHLDADELHRKAKKKYPRISLSTVYRNLQLFKKLGLIAEHHFIDEHHLYEVKPTTEHQHLVCVNCGKIIEFSCPLSGKFRDEIGAQYDFDVTSVDVKMMGYCSQCRSRNGKSG
jgi:Fur family transcriptional regulator, ferric uptake regulator